MGVAPLFAERVRRLVTDEETPLRSAAFPAETVDVVYRFGASVGSVVHRFDRLDRGMEHARRLIAEAEAADRAFPSGTVILAKEMTGSKGRFRRVWHAPPGGIWLTLVLVNTLLPRFTNLYPLAAGLAACETARHFGIEAQVKWVNDVHAGGGKLAGILTETYRGPRFGEEYILVGIGLNVNNAAFPPELAGIATSMATLVGHELSVDDVAARLLAKLAWAVGLLHYDEEAALASDDGSETPGSRPLLLDQWLALSDTVGRRVLFGYDVQQSPQYEAVVVGVDDDGGLRLHRPDLDATLVEHAGEIAYLD